MRKLIGSFSNGDSNETRWKSDRFEKKNKILAYVQQNFFVHFFPSLQDHDFRGIRFSYAMFQLWKMQTHEEEFFFLLLNLGSVPNNSDSPTYEKAFHWGL